MLPPFLARWFGPRPRPDLRVMLYTRAGCHLCDDAWAVLEEARHRYGFALEARDVDAAPDLAAAYGLSVPVVTVNGKVRFRGRVNAVLLRRLLEAGPAAAEPGTEGDSTPSF
jgi:glutaredoxin